MKSAYELALERSGGKLQDIDADSKAELAELESKYKAKIAEAELAARQRLAKAAGDPAAEEQISDDLTVELASLRSRWDRERGQIRDETENE